MAKQTKYDTDTNISPDDKFTGIDADDSNKTKNFKVGALLEFFKSETVNLYEVEGYLVWKGSGEQDETALREGNIVLGRGNILSDVILGEVLQDNPTQESHFNMLIQTT